MDISVGVADKLLKLRELLVTNIEYYITSVSSFLGTKILKQISVMI